MTHKKPLHTPHRSSKKNKNIWREYPRTISDDLQKIAAEKGYRIDRGIRDHQHVVLECLTCGGHTAQRIATLRTAQPACAPCQLAARHSDAEAVGITLLRRDDDHRHDYWYLLPCGHEKRLQWTRVQRLAREGFVPNCSGFHCEPCYKQELKNTAAQWGWSLVGADPDENPNYRLLSHDACGHQQRVATANIETGRFNCGACGECWTAAESIIYLMRFRVPEFGTFVKAGFSKNPDSRMRHQLGLREDVEAEILDEVPTPSGQVAIRLEKDLHRRLRAAHPGKVVPRERLRPWVKVTSEIYTADAEPIIRRMLDEIESPRWPRKTKIKPAPED
ncbi:GIY-YIG nuclease family protein [Roseovarius nanhaiticus]|uniref:GIY-YIG nuclease family protein n=1 Tax=Roseovarius nanhaiticus TaxID=573024 RepID=UPI00249038C8|nr:GIY-YIG nuclease family protein [Roseovarius nanhaiticus]